MKQKTAQYMAGLFDAEGCLTINSSFRKLSNCPGYTAQIIFTNTNLQLMKWIVENFGGVYKARKMIAGCVQAYDWKVTNQKHALSFLSIIKSYLIVKNQEAELMLQYYALNGKEDPESRKELCEKIKPLKWNRGSVTTDMPNASNVSNAYFAGFVDGDGSISSVPTLFAGNSHSGVIELFAKHYGGSVTARTFPNVNWSNEYRWSLGNPEKVEKVLLCWLPYLIDKRSQAMYGLSKLREVKIQSELTGDRESDLVGTLDS